MAWTNANPLLTKYCEKKKGGGERRGERTRRTERKKPKEALLVPIPGKRARSGHGNERDAVNRRFCRRVSCRAIARAAGATFDFVVCAIEGTLRDDPCAYLLHLLVVQGHRHDPRTHLHNRGNVARKHAHVTRRRRHLHLVNLRAVELDVVRHVEVQRELRGRRRGNLRKRLHEGGGRARVIHRRRLDGLERAHETRDGLLLRLGRAHRGRAERAGRGRGRDRPERGETRRGVTKSHRG